MSSEPNAYVYAAMVFYISGEAFMDNYPEMPPAKARLSEPLRA